MKLALLAIGIWFAASLPASVIIGRMLRSMSIRDGREYESCETDSTRDPGPSHCTLCDAVSIHGAGHRDFGLHSFSRSFRG